MNKVKQMLEALEKDLREKRQYSAADKLLPIIEEAEKAKEEILKQLETLPFEEHSIMRERKEVPEYFKTIRTYKLIRLDKAIEIVKSGGK